MHTIYVLCVPHSSLVPAMPASPPCGSKLRICVLQSSFEGSVASIKGLDPYRAPSAYDTAGKYEWHCEYIKKATAGRQLTVLAHKGFDVFLNLCDGAFDEDRAGLEVVLGLER